MKKVFRTIFALAVAAAALSACKKENLEGETVKAGIPVQFVAEQIATKTQFGTPESGSIPVLWTAGDKIKAMCHAEAKEAVVADVEVTPLSDGKKGSFQGELSPTFPYTFYALSPSSAYISATSNKTYGNYLQYAVPTSQSPEAGKIDPAAVVLLAQTETLTAAPEGVVSLSFEHLTAYGKVSLKNLDTGGHAVNSISLDFGTVGVAGRFIYEEVTKSNHINENSQAYSITINTSETEDVLFGIGAADISGASLTVIVGVDNGTYTKTITVPADKKFKEGVISAFSIDMSGAAFNKAKTYKLVTDLSTLAEGDELIIASVKTYETDNITGHSILSTQVNTNNIQATCCEDCFTDDATIYNPPTNVEIFTLVKSAVEGTWCFKAASSGNYLARLNKSVGSNYAGYYSVEDMAGDEAILKSASWTVSEEDAQTHAVTMKSNCPLENLTRVYLRTNIGSSYIFSCYESGKQDPICFYRAEESDEPEPEKVLTVERQWGKYPGEWPQLVGYAANQDRCVAMDEDYIYVAKAAEGAAGIKAISIADPSVSKDVNVTGVAGGHFPTACVRTIYSSTKGKHILLASSMSLAEGQPLKVYAWDNGIDAAPTVLLNWTLGADRRFGDFFTAFGTFEDGEVYFRNNTQTTDAKCNLTAQFVLKNGKFTAEWPNAFFNGYGGSKGMGSIYLYQKGGSKWYLVTPDIGMFFPAGEQGGEEWGNGDDYSVWAKIYGVEPFEFNGQKYIAYLKMHNAARGWLTIIKDVNGTDAGFKDSLIKGKEAENIVFQGAVQIDSDTPSKEVVSGATYSANTMANCDVVVKDDAVYIVGHQQNTGIALFKMYMK